MTVRVPMDSMRRVTVREQDYFYHWIPGFSLGLALPNNYQVRGGLQLGQTNSIDGWYNIAQLGPSFKYKSKVWTKAKL